MSKRIRFTALLLAVSLFLNTASLPVTAEGALDSTLFTQEESVPTTAETQYTTPPQETVTEAATETTAAAASEAPTEATTETTTEATTEATEGTTEATTEATEDTTEATTGETEETSEATDATEETTEATTEAPQEPIRGKVVCTTSVNIRSGPGTGYEILGSAYNEDVVYVYEIAHMEDADWGRIGEGRWICLTYVILEGTEPTEGTEATEATEAPQATEETTEATTEATEPTEESKETEATETTEATDATETTESTEATDATELPELEAEPALLNLDATTPDFEKAKNQDVRPGEMDLVWWAAVCGKEKSMTAWVDRNAAVSALAEEPVDAAPVEEETAPTEESTVPATEETTIPSTEETTVPSTEETTVPSTEETTAPTTEETTVPVTEAATTPVTEAATVPVTEAATVPETTAASADIQSLSDAEVVAFTDVEDTPTTTDTSNLIPADNKIPIENAADLICLSYVKPEYYQDLIIEVGPNGGVNELNIVSDQTTPVNGEVLHFRGLGDSSFPFKGSFLLHNTSNTAKITLDKALFEYLSGSAVIGTYSSESEYGYVTLNCAMPETASLEQGRSKVLLADHVTEAAGVAAEWYVALYTSQETSSDIPPLLPLLNFIDTGCTAKVRIKSVTVDYSKVSEPKEPVVTGSGFLCNTMAENSVLTITGIADIPEVKNEIEGSHTGGLVGTMADSAKLDFTNVAALTMNSVSAAAKGNAGGLVGYAINPKFIALPTITAVKGATIKGNDAGGLVGWMEVSSSSEQDQTFKLTQQLTGLTVEGEYSSGGLFGVLCNNGGSYTISGIESNVTFSRDSTDNTNAGGLIGAYTASKLEDTLTLTGNTTASTLTKAVNNYGGLIGRVWCDGAPVTNQPAYVKIDDATVTTTESATPKSYGGLIGSLDEVGNMVHVTGAVSITSNYNGKNQFIGSDASGGLVGRMKQGVLRLSSVPNWAKATPTGGSAAKRGWILGERDNTLVYSDADGWLSRTDDADTNDTGVWGQVLRADLLDPNLLTFNKAAHTVTVRAINPSTGTGEVGTEEAASGQADSVSISDVTAFAALALRLQLDEKGSGALRFDGGDYTSRDNVSISLEGNIDLTATTNDETDAKSCVGLTGLTRDVNSTPLFSFTIDGKGHTVTLPDLMIYASNGGHDRQGLFGKADEFTVSNLAVAGNVTAKAISGDGIYAGALLAEANSAVDLTTVTSSVGMTITGGSGDNCAYAGIVASLSPECTSVSLNGCILSDKSIIIDSTSKKSYVGGFVGFANRNGNQSGIHTELSVTNCSLSGTLKKRELTSEYVRIGGLIATMYHGTYSLTVSGLKVSGLTVSAPDMSSGSCGGLLGYEWMNTTADISGVSIDGCSLNANSALFGGLLYKSSGYWKVHQGTDADSNPIPGIHFTGNQSTFNGASSNTTPSGLLVSRGDNILNSDGSQKGALYMEIGDGAYQIDSTDKVQVTLSGSEYFDEIVGITEGSYGNGIVSYATAGNAPIDQGGCNTYQKQLSTDYNNPNTRYYYNLDSFQDNNDGRINTPQEMVLLSAYRHADSSIKSYFSTNGTVMTGNLDLTGYSYYPVPFDGSVSIQGATITFDYANLQNMEAANKQPSNNLRQHYEMHTGIFTDAIQDGENGTLLMTINGLTLKGTIGIIDDNSGALIRGNAQGYSPNNPLVMDITGISLDGIRVYPAITKSAPEKAPLLIGSIGNYSTLAMVDVRTTNSYAAYQETAINDGTEFYAATSLIGPVGGERGTGIQLEFSKMALDGRTIAGEKLDVYGTYLTVFRDALFLQQFQYVDNCKGVYNFEKEDPYTLGRELSNTDGGDVSGRNNNEQYFYFNSSEQICGEGNDPAAFYKNYQRYVVNGEKTDDAQTLHELDINQMSPDMTEGCGTYSHPYIIRFGNQLKALQTALTSSPTPGINNGWTIILNQEALGTNFTKGANHTDASSDYTQDVQYTCISGVWTALDSNGEPTATTASTTDVLKYLRNAYYKLEGPGGEGAGAKTIILDDWNGLGGPSTDTAFSGVIIGVDGVTVQINTPSATQFGGLIKFSQGSVVKNVSIHSDTSTSIEYSGIPSNDSAPFFGGVVGWCIGGDTILEDVTVTYSENALPAVTGSSKHLVAVGGYVGIVGGYSPSNTEEEQFGGGVVFRGKGFAAPSFSEENYFYCNPYVGRVLDGYAMAESPLKLNNSDNNYTIPTIAPGTHLTRSGNTVTVNDADGLWLLSAIANSGAGHMAKSTSQAYSHGKVRTSNNYDSVGTISEASSLGDEANPGGVSSSKSSSYLTQYVSGDFSDLTRKELEISILLASDCDMSSYGNGFRGIGCSYGANTNSGKIARLITVESLEGQNHTVTLKQNRNEYTEEKSTWTSIGTGLFVHLCVVKKESTFSNLNLKGSTGIAYYTGTSLATTNSGTLNATSALNNDTRLSLVGAGMLAGNFAKYTNVTMFTVKNVHLLGATDDPVKVNPEGAGTTFAGGLIGLLRNSNTVNAVKLEDCQYTHLSVNGRVDVGGFVGYSNAKKFDIIYTKATVLEDGKVQSTAVKYYSNDGVGGLVGSIVNGALNINASSEMLTIKDLIVSTKVTNAENYVGGLIGIWVLPKLKSGTVANVTMEGKIDLHGSSSSNVKSCLGLIAGFIRDEGSNWTSNGDGFNLTISNIQIAQDNSTVVLQDALQMGGLVGLFKSPTNNNTGNISISNIRMGSAQGSVSIFNGKNTLLSDRYSYNTVGGLMGCVGLCPNITVSDVRITNTKLISVDYAAAFFARTSSQVDTIKIDVSNSEVSDCTIAICRDKRGYNNVSTGAGFVYGMMDDNKSNQFTGFNLLFKNNTVGYTLASNGTSTEIPSSTDGLTIGLRNSNNQYLSYDSIISGNLFETYNGGEIGIIGGTTLSGGTKTAKLIGVSLLGNKTPMQDFANKPSADSYVIRADYLADTSGTTGSAYPHVTTSPAKEFAGINVTGPNGNAIENALTGDGVAFVESIISIAQKIKGNYDENTVPRNQVHFSVPEAMSFLDVSILSDFNTAGENGTNYTGPNFPVLLISENTTGAINNLVAAYISVMTNHVEYTGTISGNNFAAVYTSGLFTISPTTYKWDGSAWKAVTNTLKVGTDNQTLSVNNGRYDNQLNQFTLLDVAYADPSGTKEADGITVKKVYHLYIPVVVKKVMEFKFWASAKDGTDYYTGAYDGLEYPAIGSHGNQVTALITYEYQRTKDEWQAAIDNGENLMWNFPKILMLGDGSGFNLPVGTKLTLVDRNNLNQVYYHTTGASLTTGDKGRLELPLSLFGLKEVPLCSLLNLSVEEDSSGTYIETNAADATIQAKGTYYCLATDEEKADAKNTFYRITVSDEAKQEQYYLTIQTPGDASVFVNLLVECEDRLSNPTGKVGLPTTRLPAKEDNSVQYARKGAENRIVIDNFFTQTVTITNEGQDLMSDTNLTVTGTLNAKIQFADGTALKNFDKFCRGRSLYQQFSLYLKKSVNSSETVVPYAEGTVLTVGNKSYPIGGETYHKLDIKQVSISTDGDNPKAVVEIPFTLSYTLSGIEAQFPKRVDPTDGILVYAESSLSYDSQMQQSGLKGTGNGTNRYYREEVHLATLTYNAYENAYGTQRYGWSQLGINDLDSNGDYQILSAALYDVHELTSASSADKLKISVKLLQKTDDGDYVDVSEHLSSYLNSITVSPKGNPTVISTAAASVRYGAAEFRIADTGFNSSVPIEIDVDMNVITGAAFENAGLTYANYKLVLTAELLHKGERINGSDASDYIIYTNAKIIPTLVS